VNQVDFHPMNSFTGMQMSESFPIFAVNANSQEENKKSIWSGLYLCIFCSGYIIQYIFCYWYIYIFVCVCTFAWTQSAMV